MTLQPEFIEAAKWLGAILVGALGWFLRQERAKINRDLESKADKASMALEIQALRGELKEARETREKDIDRLERMHDGKITAMANELRARMESMEKSMDGKLDMLLEMMRQRAA